MGAGQTNVLYLRSRFQGWIWISSGSWFSPGSVVPPHNGVGDGMPPKGPLRGRLASGASTFDSEVIRPPSQWDLVPRVADLGCSHHVGSASFVQANSVPSRQSRVRITASFLAVATVAFFSPFRCTSRIAQAFRGLNLATRWIRMLAAS